MCLPEIQRRRQEELHLAQREWRRVWLAELWKEHLDRSCIRRLAQGIVWLGRESWRPMGLGRSGEPR